MFEKIVQIGTKGNGIVTQLGKVELETSLWSWTNGWTWGSWIIISSFVHLHKVQSFQTSIHSSYVHQFPETDVPQFLGTHPMSNFFKLANIHLSQFPFIYLTFSWIQFSLIPSFPTSLGLIHYFWKKIQI